MSDKEKEVIVVGEFPKQEVTSIADKDGKEYDLITEQQALTEILKILKEIKGKI